MRTPDNPLALLHSSPDPMLSIARDGHIVQANHMAANFFGYSLDELLTMKVESLIPERFREQHVHHREGFFESPHFRPMGLDQVLFAKTKDGREPNVEISLSYHGDGEDRLASVTLRDVTDRVAARQALHDAQEELQIMLDHSPDPMLTIDQSGSIVRANKMAVQFFGHAHPTLLRMKVEELIPERFRPNHESFRDDYFANPHFRPMGLGRTLRALTADGREPDVEISLSHHGSGEHRRATVTLRDVTEQVAAANKLREARAQAEDALNQQRAMQEELVQAEKLAALGGLVAGVAHEVNTPIGVALSAASHLDKETRKVEQLYADEELGEEDLQDYFHTAKESSRLLMLNIKRAADLVQSFKQVAVDQVSGEQRSFELKAYLEEILLSLRPSLRNHQVDIRLNCVQSIMMDSNPGALSQVITNLINNALLHAFDAPGEHWIQIEAQRDGESVVLSCQDNGKGIPKADQDKVFDPFFTTRRNAGGSGLGLHIVFNLVRQTLGGSIELCSEPGQGTQLTLKIPRILSPATIPDA